MDFKQLSKEEEEILHKHYWHTELRQNEMNFEGGLKAGVSDITEERVQQVKDGQKVPLMTLNVNVLKTFYKKADIETTIDGQVFTPGAVICPYDSKKENQIFKNRHGKVPPHVYIACFSKEG